MPSHACTKESGCAILRYFGYFSGLGVTILCSLIITRINSAMLTIFDQTVKIQSSEAHTMAVNE